MCGQKIQCACGSQVCVNIKHGRSQDLMAMLDLFYENPEDFDINTWFGLADEFWTENQLQTCGCTLTTQQLHLKLLSIFIGN